MWGYRSYGAIADWGCNYGKKLVKALGFTREQTPCAATLHTVFRNLDREELEAEWGEWAEGVLEATLAGEGEGAGIVVEGKTLRGSRQRKAPGVQRLSAVGQRLGLALAP
jgi:hypothetical protein